MARISKGKFRNLRDHFTAQKYFTITTKNIESMKIMLGDNIEVGERYVMRNMPISDEVAKALSEGTRIIKGRSINMGLVGGLANESLKTLMCRPTRWAT